MKCPLSGLLIELGGRSTGIYFALFFSISHVTTYYNRQFTLLFDLDSIHVSQCQYFNVTRSLTKYCTIFNYPANGCVRRICIILDRFKFISMKMHEK